MFHIRQSPQVGDFTRAKDFFEPLGPVARLPLRPLRIPFRGSGPWQEAQLTDHPLDSRGSLGAAQMNLPLNLAISFSFSYWIFWGQSNPTCPKVGQIGSLISQDLDYGSRLQPHFQYNEALRDNRSITFDCSGNSGEGQGRSTFAYLKSACARHASSLAYARTGLHQPAILLSRDSSRFGALVLNHAVVSEFLSLVQIYVDVHPAEGFRHVFP